MVDEEVAFTVDFSSRGFVGGTAISIDGAADVFSSVGSFGVVSIADVGASVVLCSPEEVMGVVVEVGLVCESTGRSFN